MIVINLISNKHIKMSKIVMWMKPNQKVERRCLMILIMCNWINNSSIWLLLCWSTWTNIWLMEVIMILKRMMKKLMKLSSLGFWKINHKNRKMKRINLKWMRINNLIYSRWTRMKEMLINKKKLKSNKRVMTKKVSKMRNKHNLNLICLTLNHL